MAEVERPMTDLERVVEALGGFHSISIRVMGGYRWRVHSEIYADIVAQGHDTASLVEWADKQLAGRQEQADG